MALRPIVQEVQSSDDLPWANEYIATIGKVGDSAFVTELILSSKGVIVITDVFKGFLFKGSKIYDFLIEALEVWTADTISYPPLFAIVAKEGKITLAIDDELEFSRWTVTKPNKSFEQKIKKGADSGSNATNLNPFLPISPPPTSSGRKTK